jgi:hypothetical protein
MSLQAHDKVAKALFKLANYVRALNGKVTHAARVFGVQWAQQAGLTDEVRRRAGGGLGCGLGGGLGGGYGAGSAAGWAVGCAVGWAVGWAPG